MKNTLENARDIRMRHEEKYLCPESWLKMIECRLKNFLPSDKNQKGKDYFVRSLYFDTSTDRLYEDSVNGVEVRNKYRVRIYDNSPNFIKVEKKTSIRDLKKKFSITIKNFDIEPITGAVKWPDASGKEASVLKEILFLEKTELLKPKIIVDYRRTAFINEIGNVRITLDRNIRTTDRIREFYDAKAVMVPLLPENMNLLEVKYDSILPGYIVKLLDINKLEQLSFSKYVLCRDMIMNNGRKCGLYEF